MAFKLGKEDRGPKLPGSTNLFRKKISNDDRLTSELIKEMGYSTVVEESRKLDISVQEFLALSVGTVRGIEADTNGK